jgi:DNA ligase (NAD+)
LETTESGAFTLCSNPNCPGKLVGRVERFLVKAGIKGIREETLQKLHDAGLILGIPSIFSLNEEEVAAVPGLGRSTARLISSALTSHKWVDYEVLAGAGIEGIGNTLSKALCSRFTLEEIMEQFDERGFTVEVTQVEGFSVDRAGALLEGVAARFDEMAETYNAIEERYGMEKLREKRAAESAGTKRPAGVPAGSLTFVVTGKTSRFQTRGDLQTELERLGHRVTGSVTKNTYALITNDTGSGSEKNRKAVELGVRVMSEDEAIDLFGLVP